jgi:CheY-like chemotaxis protein
MKKILVVDDDPAILDVTTIILESDGYQVEAHESGECINSLLEKDTNELPALVLLDLLLSGEDGIELCKNLKKNPKTKNIPVVLFSAHFQENQLTEIPEIHHDYFLPKPFDINRLSKIVNELTARNSLS